VVGAEPSPYPFGGSISGPSFIRDLAATSGWSSGESVEIDTAMDRLRRFEMWSADVAFAPQTSSSASQIIPPGYRTVTEIALGTDRPLASACEQLPITSSAPFTSPTVTGDGTVPASRAEGTNPSGTDPTFSIATASPEGLAGKIDLTRELVDSASPSGDVIALQVMREDFYRRIENRLYAIMNLVQAGTITGDTVPTGAQAASDGTPTTTLHTTLKKRLLAYAVIRRRKARNVIVGRAALDNLAGLLTTEDTTGDDTALARIWGAKVNASVNDFATGSTDMRIAILGSGDVYNCESPLVQFRFNEQAGPALVSAALWGYHATLVARPRGLSSIRF
jgi:hypothetical protein